jgi:hypothetical protein
MSAAVPIERTRLGACGPVFMAASNEKRAPKGRNIPQNISSRKVVSPAFRTRGLRPWSETVRIKSPNSAQRVRHPTSSAIANRAASRNIAPSNIAEPPARWSDRRSGVRTRAIRSARGKTPASV